MVVSIGEPSVGALNTMQVKLQKPLGNIELNVDLTLPDSGITAIFGRSGTGKTSLIQLISGLMKADSGRVVLKDRVLFDSDRNLNLAIEKRRIGYVFQEPRLFPHYRVKGNLMYGVRQFDAEYFECITQLLGIENLLSRYPMRLSGGEKQRVAIGRALLSQPDLLLMDEPLSALDLPRKQELLPYLVRLSQELRIPILYVTHSLEEILRLADHMVVMEEGKVMTSGDIETVWQSPSMLPWLSHQRVRSVLSGRVHSVLSSAFLSEIRLSPSCLLRVPSSDFTLGEQVRLSVFADDVLISLAPFPAGSLENTLRMTVAHLDCQAQRVIVHLVFEQTRLMAQISSVAMERLGLNLGQVVWVGIIRCQIEKRL